MNKFTSITRHLQDVMSLSSITATRYCTLFLFSVFSFIAKGQGPYFTHIYGSQYDDKLTAGIQMSQKNAMVAVGWGDPGGLYFLSVDNTGAPITPAMGFTTNGKYKLHAQSYVTCNSVLIQNNVLCSAPSEYIKINDVCEYDAALGLVALTGSVSYDDFTQLLVMIMGIDGTIYSIAAYVIQCDGYAEKAEGNAIIAVPQSNGDINLFVTGYITIGLHKRLMVAKLNYNAGGGIVKIWDRFYYSNNLNLLGTQTEGNDIVYNTSNTIQFDGYGRLLVVGDAVDANNFISAIAINIEEINGNPTSSNLNLFYSAAGNAPTMAMFKSVKLDVPNGYIYIGGQGFNSNVGISPNQDFLLYKMDFSGTFKWANFYNSDRDGRDDFFNSMILASNSNIYLTGYSYNFASPVTGNDILLFKVENTAGHLLSSFGFGSSGDDKGIDISETTNSAYLTLYNQSDSYWTQMGTCTGNLPPTHTPATNIDFDLVTIDYNGWTYCDKPTFTGHEYEVGSASTVEYTNQNPMLQEKYYFTYCNDDGCEYQKCFTYPIPPTTGVENVTKKQSLMKYYPTILAEDNTIHFELSCDNLKAQYQVDIYDYTGKLIKHIVVNSVNKFNIDLGEDLNAGMYFIQLHINGESLLAKVIKN